MTDAAQASTFSRADAAELGVFTRLARTSLFLDALQRQCLEPFALSFTDYSVLRTLRYAGSPYRLSPKRLADTVLCTTGGMTKIIDRLERAGLVERQPDPEDRRALLVALTRRGIRTGDKASDAYTQGRQRVLARLSRSEVGEIERALGRLLDVLEADHDGDTI